MRIFGLLVVVALMATPAFAQTQGSVEDVQFKSIDLAAQVLELHNYGSVTHNMDGWRFCTHDETVVRRYSSSTGMNGLSLAPGESLFIHWLDDSGGAAGTIDRTTMGGGWISNLLVDAPGAAVSIGIYRNGSFGAAASLNDHIQYSYNGADVPSATPRSGPATDAGLWVAADDWINVDETATGIELTADPFPGAGAAHGSISYDVTFPPVVEVISPDSFELVTGALASGGIPELLISDNADLSVRRSTTSILSLAVVEFKGTTTLETPTSFTFVLEASVFARSAVTQQISLFNYDSDSFELVDTSPASRFNDATFEIIPTGDLSRFVEPGTGCVEARVRYLGSQNRLQFTANMDFIEWSIEQ